MIQTKVLSDSDLYEQNILLLPGVAEMLLRKISYTAIAATEEEKIAGLLLLKDEGERISIEYVYVLPEYRRTGIGTMLIGESCQLAEDLGRTIQCTASQRNVNPGAFHRFITSCGFTAEKKFQELCFSPELDYSEGCWEEFERATEPIIKRMKQRGYSCISFEEGNRKLKQLAREIGNDFEGGLNPLEMDGLSRKWSFLCIKDKEPAAFLAASFNDGIIDIKNFSCCRGYRNTGAAMLPLYEFVSRVMETQKTSQHEIWKVRVVIEVDEERPMMDRMLKKRFGPMCIERNRMTRYIKNSI